MRAFRGVIEQINPNSSNQLINCQGGETSGKSVPAIARYPNASPFRQR
ncbi:MAG TPA: hypothetical protein V6C57_05680 [Coleofasciculaceae cyanobacterium]